MDSMDLLTSGRDYDPQSHGVQGDQFDLAHPSRSGAAP